MPPSNPSKHFAFAAKKNGTESEPFFSVKRPILQRSGALLFCCARAEAPIFSPSALARRCGAYRGARLILSAQHIAPSTENIAAPFNKAIRAGDSLFAISCDVFACPRHYTVGPAIMENSGLRWVKVDHWSQGRWRIRHC